MEGDAATIALPLAPRFLLIEHGILAAAAAAPPYSGSSVLSSSSPSRSLPFPIGRSSLADVSATALLLSFLALFIYTATPATDTRSILHLLFLPNNQSSSWYFYAPACPSSLALHLPFFLPLPLLQLALPRLLFSNRLAPSDR